MKYLILFTLMSCSLVKEVKEIKGVRPVETKFFPLWFKNNDPIHQTGNLPIATNWPATKGGILYVGDNRGQMVAYDFSSGREVWREQDGATYSAAPTFYKDTLVYGTSSGRVFARNRLNGKMIYNVDLGSSVETQGRVYKGIIFFQLRDHKLVALDVKTGKVLWGYKRSVPYLTTVQRASRPLIFENKVYIGFADGYFCSFRMEDGVLLWETKLSEGTKFVDVDLSPVLYKGKILTGSLAGPLHELDPKTGRVFRRFSFTASRAPFIYKNMILVGTPSGELIVFDGKFKELKRLRLGDLPISSIKSWKNDFVISSVGRKVHLLDKTSLKLDQHFDLGHVSSAVFGDVVVEKGMLAFLSSRNRLYVFK